MFLRRLANFSMATLVGAMMFAAPTGSASAFTLASPSLSPSLAAASVDKVWWRGGWRGGWGWRGGGWGWRGGWGGWRGPGWGWRGYGWGPAAVVGGVAAGAVVGSALSSPYYYGPCWRQVVGPYGGWHWRRIC
jgi:hypothetical protein